VGKPFRFVDASIERIDNITVDKQDETLGHGTEGHEDRSCYKVEYCEFFQIAPDMGLIGILI
jgi:hypothetical protein